MNKIVGLICIMVGAVLIGTALYNQIPKTQYEARYGKAGYTSQLDALKAAALNDCIIWGLDDNLSAYTVLSTNFIVSIGNDTASNPTEVTCVVTVTKNGFVKNDALSRVRQ
jgi:hypothetical protein